jgi:hypothetical protein
LRFEDGVSRRRSRKKTIECFTGEEAIFAALEGNPRWVKAVFSQFIGAYDGQNPISRGLQFDTLAESAERFEALLRLLPVHGTFRDATVLSLLDDIAAYFSFRSLGAFSADPPGTFIVDQSVPPYVIDALNTALSAGAVIHLRSKKSPDVLSNLYGERFRLAYLLAVREGLEFPLRLGHSTSLTAVLTWARLNRGVNAEQTDLETPPTLWVDEDLK